MGKLTLRFTQAGIGKICGLRKRIPLDRQLKTCDGWSIRFILAVPLTDSSDRHRPLADSFGHRGKIVTLEDPNAMLHFSCDICGKDLTDGSPRYVVKMEMQAATEPALLTDEDLDADHVEEMAQLLNAIEDGDEAPPALLPACQKMRFDLCLVCSGKFIKDPLGREAATRFDFSEN